MLRFGLIVNPLAGIGGSVGLKGSDAVAEEAFARGAQQKAMQRTEHGLQALVEVKDQCRFLTCAGDMGANTLTALGLDFELVNVDIPLTNTTAEHTRKAALSIAQAGVDVLVFAGGDGTARDICAVLEEQELTHIPVLGIPAGVKIHSGVYGVTPQATGQVLAALIAGELIDIKEAEVRDLDEQAFRENRVQARHYGDLRVPQMGHFVQAVKQGGVEVEELVLVDIASYLVEEMEDDVLYFIGSGKTTQAVMDELGLEHTLLGVDAVYDGQLIAADINEQRILELLQQYPQSRAILSVMGGQGHIIGRGNQQFSAKVLSKLGKGQLDIISTKSKISALEGRPLIIDSGDPQLDRDWEGTIEIITGYRDRIVHTLQ